MARLSGTTHPWWNGLPSQLHPQGWFRAAEPPEDRLHSHLQAERPTFACRSFYGRHSADAWPELPVRMWHAAPRKHQALHLTLKSGNFGTDDFFTKAFSKL